MILTKPYKYLASLALGLVIASCSSSADIPKGSPSVILDPKVELNAFDKWLQENLVTPYNIELKYTLEDNETSMSYHLAPADKQKSIQLAHLIQYLCFEPYDEVTGSTTFIRSLFPKVVQLVGSPAYNVNGSRILGSAEGGRKMTLYTVNQLNVRDVADMNENFFHTMHHEFGHIQNQTKRFSEAFDKVTPRGYTGDTWTSAWNNPSDVVSRVKELYTTEKIKSYISKGRELSAIRAKLTAGTATTAERQRALELINEVRTLQADAVFQRESRAFNLIIKYLGGEDLTGRTHRPIFEASDINALRAGFVTPYASKNADEDFVEIQSCYITDTPETWSMRLLLAGTNRDTSLGENALREKFNIVKNYLATEWKIDLDKLRESVHRRQAALPTEAQLNDLTLKQADK